MTEKHGQKLGDASTVSSLSTQRPGILDPLLEAMLSSRRRRRGATIVDSTSGCTRLNGVSRRIMRLPLLLVIGGTCHEPRARGAS